MRNFKRLLQAAIGLIVAAACLLFVLENQQAVALSFLGWSGPEWPVAVLVLLAFLLGLAIGPLIGWFIAMRGRRRVRRAALAQQRAAQVPPQAS
ncbi:lipopolysaccharide assembly protein LapA domain-containing protein [Pseudomonas typographi]|uniref:DUF1049 domain-containing protein n=1 Tax=Pseudomonas typographi TaxID=2715964 RepID=A0ABR7Z493_9PSED|nr:DUF1049 domain-containing protein [Pseudomonas typographi]MBD1588247.1 DUF1049 domain-containing protein [Pseudomonas typographi]MBD1600218.1 DUF1049 domain-containing protein [Pseudomonas typographi]